MTDVTIQVPEDVAEDLMARSGADPPRAVIEVVAREGYRSRELMHAQVMRLPGLKNRVEVHGCLKRVGMYLEYTESDLEREEKPHQRVLRR